MAEKGKARRPLTPAEERFCHYYVADPQRNRTKAAALAGYSEKTAYSQGSRLLKRVEVLERVRELEREALGELIDDLDGQKKATLRQILALALSDITDVAVIARPSDTDYAEAAAAQAEANGGQYGLPLDEPIVYVRSTRTLPSEVTAAIKSIKRTRHGSIDVEMHDKSTPLRMLAEIAGLTKGDGVTLNVSLAERITDARHRTLDGGGDGGGGADE